MHTSTFDVLATIACTLVIAGLIMFAAMVLYRRLPYRSRPRPVCRRVDRLCGRLVIQGRGADMSPVEAKAIQEALAGAIRASSRSRMIW
jgi:hypothetical protein